MIKFEEHEGKLFRMLEESVPLTPDAEMPCLIRLIQDDSPMGRYNKAYSEYKYGVKLGCCLLPIIATHIGKNGIVNDIEWDINRYEIIGYPVVEGSAEWALYQMMQGFTVSSGKGYPTRLNGNYVCCGSITLAHINDFLSIAVSTGWQIHKEPEPQYKVGDWVEIYYNSHTMQELVTEATKSKIKTKNYEFDITGMYCRKIGERGCIWGDVIRITRKLKPSEVIVKIGCLRGTVERAPYIQNGFNLVSEAGNCFILFNALDATTRELVGDLLNAQDEK